MEIRVNDITLHYTKEGNGLPIILLHGNGEDHHIFDALILKLKNDFTVYAIDSRNHGLSSKTNDFGYEIMATDIIGFIRNVGLQKPSIIGFSDGAIISLLIALQDNSIFNKIVLLGVNLKPSDFKEENLEWLKTEYKNTNDPLLRLMLEEPDIELDSLKNIPNPTLVVAAEDDIFKEQLFHDITATMPNAQLKIITGYDHAGYVIDQDILYNDLIEFL